MLNFITKEDNKIVLLRNAAETGRLKIVKYMTEHGANIHALNDFALKAARKHNHLRDVKYLEDHA